MARFGFAGGLTAVFTLMARGDGAAAGFGFAGAVTGVFTLIARGAAGAAAGDALGLPPAPTVVHAPELELAEAAAGEVAAGALPARSAYRFPTLLGGAGGLVAAVWVAAAAAASAMRCFRASSSFWI